MVLFLRKFWRPFCIKLQYIDQCQVEAAFVLQNIVLKQIFKDANLLVSRYSRYKLCVLIKAVHNLFIFTSRRQRIEVGPRLDTANRVTVEIHLSQSAVPQTS